MNRSIWSIVVIGFLTVVFMVMAMLVMFQEYSRSPYSSSTKLAISIRNEFHFESVGSGTKDEGPRHLLVIQYETHANSKFDTSVQTREMQKVAEFAAEKYDPIERKRIDEIRVQRTEIHGRGCFQQSYVADHSIPNPHFNPLPPRRP